MITKSIHWHSHIVKAGCATEVEIDELELGKLKAQLSFHKQTGIREIPVFLVLGGSFNPIHSYHLRIFDVVREYLSKRGMRAIGGFLAISSESYVMNKLGSLNTIKIRHRVELCRRATNTSNWIVEVPWGWQSARQVQKTIKNLIYSHFRKEIQGFQICGTDYALKIARKYSAFPKYCICVGREPYVKELKKLIENKTIKADNFFLVDTVLEDISSTKIRELILAGQWSQLLHTGWISSTNLKYIQNKMKKNILFINHEKNHNIGKQ